MIGPSIAIEAVKFLKSSYDRIYGEYGKKVVNKYKRKLKSARLLIKNLIAEIKELRKQIKHRDKIVEAQDKTIEALTEDRNKFRDLANKRLLIIKARENVKPVEGIHDEY